MTVSINGVDYTLLDRRKSSVSDSFVKTNKLVGHDGHGEAKLYVGGVEDASAFFGEEEIKKGFFTRLNIQDYLDNAKYEYRHPKQDYKRGDISSNLSAALDKLSAWEEDVFQFEFSRSDVNPPRYYINCSSDREGSGYYQYMREILLPRISCVDIYKLSRGNEEIFYYFKLDLEIPFDRYHHPFLIAREEKAIRGAGDLDDLMREEVIKARNGQGVFRDSLLRESAKCVITGVDDDRVLIASHIKPWSKSDNEEKLDKYNGLLLTPTYDKLFDRGFISFDENGLLLASSYMAPKNLNRLGVVAGERYSIPNLEHKDTYLAFHRENIFQT